MIELPGGEPSKPTTLGDYADPTKSKAEPDVIQPGYDNPHYGLGEPQPSASAGMQIMFNIASAGHMNTWTEELSSRLHMFDLPGDNNMLTAEEANKEYPMTQGYKAPVKAGQARRAFENQRRQQVLGEVLSSQNTPTKVANFMGGLASGLIADPVQTGAIYLATLGTANVAAKLLPKLGEPLALASNKAVQRFGNILTKAPALVATEGVPLGTRIIRDGMMNVGTGLVASPIRDHVADYFNTTVTYEQARDQAMMDFAFGAGITGLGGLVKKLGNRTSENIKADAENISAAGDAGKKSIVEFAKEKSHEPVYKSQEGDFVGPKPRGEADITKQSTIESAVADEHALYKYYELDKVKNEVPHGPYVNNMGHASPTTIGDKWVTGLEVHGGSWDNVHTYGPDSPFGSGIILSTDKNLINEIGATNKTPNNNLGELTLHRDAILLNVDRPPNGKVYGLFLEFMNKEMGIDFQTVRKIFPETMPLKNMLSALSEFIEEVSPIDKFNKILAKEMGIHGYTWETPITRENSAGETTRNTISSAQVFEDKYVSIDKTSPIPHNPSSDYYGADLRNEYKTFLGSRESGIDFNPQIEEVMNKMAEDLNAKKIYQYDAERHTKKIENDLEALAAQEKYSNEGELEFGTDATSIAKKELSDAIKKGQQRAKAVKEIFKEMENCMFGKGEI
jgi:hypothetical protein